MHFEGLIGAKGKTSATVNEFGKLHLLTMTHNAQLQTIPGLVRKQATILLYGHGHAGVDMSVLNNVMFKEPTLVTPVGASGGFSHDGRPSVYVHALDLIERQLIDVASIITHRYMSLDEVQGALENDIYAQYYIKGVVAL